MILILKMGGETMTCEDCKFCVLADYGYSNYTTEGTEFTCAKNLHPDGSFDRWYGKEPKLDYAQQCSGFEAGEAIRMDCDHEDLDSLTPEQKEIWVMAGNSL